MFRVFGLLCIVNALNAVDCTTHYRTDLQVYNTRADCEKATQPIMDDTLKQFKELGIVYQSFQVGCEEITAEEYRQWQIDKMNNKDDEI